MVRDLISLCENGLIRISWEWTDRNVDGIQIFYKRKETVKEDGILFTEEEIVPVPGNRRGKAERDFAGEQGLYTFIIIPKLGNSSDKKKIFIEDVMLGEPVEIMWGFFREKGNLLIRFKYFPGKIPTGIVYMEDDERSYQLDYELDKDSVLLFPAEVDKNKIRLKVKTPYNKVYHFYRTDGE